MEEVTGETYGGLKALCEVEVASRLGDRVLIVRPGILVGPGDPTGRFTYWCRRIARGGAVLAPGPATLDVQYLDARDLADWIVPLATDGATGVYNAAGPGHPLPMRGFLEGLCDGVGRGAHLEWVGEEFLLAEGVEPWTDLPLWLPRSVGSITANNSRAVAAGLRFRPLAGTAVDTLRWAAQQPDPGDGPPGLTPAREAELLARYAERADAAGASGG
ncbi:MAG: hypothetical protein M3010_00240 [Candidatus Dormibacteraeota bacterium]|nr:hypothetical protein [Candidatus Dormibacteraeota bacterium]